MTDETRAKLREVIERFVRNAQAGGKVRVNPFNVAAPTFPRVGLRLAGVQADCEVEYHEAAPNHPPLTAAQVLALNVLVGDPATLSQALADYMIDLGIDAYAAAYEKGKRAERERVLKLIDAMLASAPHPTSNHLSLLKMHVHNPEEAERLFRAAVDAIRPAATAVADGFARLGRAWAEAFGRPAEELHAALAALPTEGD